MEMYLKYKPEKLWNERYNDDALLSVWDNTTFWEKVIESNFGDVLANKDKKMSLRDYFLELLKDTQSEYEYKLVRIMIDKKLTYDVLIEENMTLKNIYDLVYSIVKFDPKDYIEKMNFNNTGKNSISFISKKDEKNNEVKKNEKSKNVNEFKYTQSLDKIVISPEKVQSEFPEVDINNPNYTIDEIYNILLACKEPKKDFELGTKVDLVMNDFSSKSPVEVFHRNFGYIYSITTNVKGRPIECTAYVFDSDDQRKVDFIWHGQPTKGRWISKDESEQYNKIIVKKLKWTNLQVNSDPWEPSFLY